MSRLQAPVFSIMTLVFTEYSDTDNKKKIVKEALENIEKVLFLDEYANGIKYFIKDEAIPEIYDALQENFIVTRLHVRGNTDELFAALTVDKKQSIDPSSASFRELDQNRMKNLF